MKLVVIGAGPAGVSVVETVRQQGISAEIVMLSSEPYPPYSPPAMVDHFLQGSGAHLWRGPDWPTRLGVEYHANTVVTTIEPDAHRIVLQDGTTIGYDRLVIATGSRLYAPLEGVDRPGIYNFKSLSAAEELVRHVRSGEARSALIVGAGFIGMEIALLLSELGVAVTQIEMMDQVMPRMLDHETAAIALSLMRQRGVDVRLNTKAAAFIGNGRATGVRLESGEVLKADILIAATGVKPNLDLLAGSGIAHQWGVTVDDHLRTNAPHIYAAGDAVEAPDRMTGKTFVHAIFPNAVAQGRVVGLNLAGYDVPYEGADSMNSLKHLGLPIMAVGVKEGDEVLQSRSPDRLRTIYLQEGRIVGFQLVNDISAAGVLRALMIQRADVRRIKRQLLEPGFGMGVLVWQALAS